MVIALIALAVALSGTAIAAVAVDFARNAGAVDRKSAVSASASKAAAAGKLVATQKRGRNRGRIPGRFISDVMQGGSDDLTGYLSVEDNKNGRVVRLLDISGVGRLNFQCRDQDPAVGKESTQTVVTFNATNAKGVNVSRLLGRNIDRAEDGVVFSAVPGTPVPIINFADSLFQLILQAGDKSVLVMGSSRSNLNRSANAACLVWGASLRIG